jgi:cobalt/nickel transport system permease protein
MHHSHIDRFAQGDSPLHRLDARAKLLAVLAYTAVLISFDRYAVAAMAPMAVAPLAWLWLSGVPVRFALRRVLLLSPFILTLALASPLYDRSAHAAAMGPWQVELTGGWLTAMNVAIKFALGVLALTAMICTTAFSSLLEALDRLKAPRLLVMQLGLLYRYLFELIDRAMRVRRARDFRGGGRAPAGRRLRAVGGIVGSLLAQTLEKSQRVELAMASRGYRGQSHGLRQLRAGWADAAMLAAMAGYLLLCRWVVPAMLGGRESA